MVYRKAILITDTSLHRAGSGRAGGGGSGSASVLGLCPFDVVRVRFGQHGRGSPGRRRACRRPSGSHRHRAHHQTVKGLCSHDLNLLAKVKSASDVEIEVNEVPSHLSLRSWRPNSEGSPPSSSVASAGNFIMRRSTSSRTHLIRRNNSNNRSTTNKINSSSR